MAQEAVTKALLDCGLTYDAVEQAVVGYCYGESTCGQRAVSERAPNAFAPPSKPALTY